MHLIQQTVRYKKWSWSRQPKIHWQNEHSQITRTKTKPKDRTQWRRGHGYDNDWYRIVEIKVDSFPSPGFILDLPTERRVGIKSIKRMIVSDWKG